MLNFLARYFVSDVIGEVFSVWRTSVTIKSHHNVGGLPKRMKLNLLEPLKFLFKDEVRILGRNRFD